jgi:hypothetical protein
VFFDKLRAIILFEADFNWLQKIVFSNKMAKLAMKHKLIPPEQCAAPGKDGSEGTLLKHFHTDHLRTMHIQHATISADLENCYDSVAHAVAALGMRSFGVRATTIAVFLSCYQTMRFYLKTAYGVAKEPYGSTAETPFSSLLQGSGLAPWTFLCVSTLMINSYKENGYGAEYLSPITLQTIKLAAAMFVDDTDLFFSGERGMTDEDFLSMVQEGINDWAKTVISTGGNIKITKSHAKVSVPIWNRGQCRPRSIRHLPVKSFTIPQRDGTIKSVKTLGYSTAMKSLGVKFAGDGKKPKEHILWKGEQGRTWTNNLRSKSYLTSRDGWKSLNTQLKPKIEFGLVAVCAPPKDLDELCGKIHHEALSPLGFNQKIYTELRTAHARYQGMGMFDLNNSCLEFKVHLMREYWNKDDCLGNMIRLCYESFLVDVGLGGNVFCKDYKKLHHLAQSCWFEHLWCLCDFLQVQVVLDQSHHAQRVREHDRCFMDVIIEDGRMKEDTLKTVGICRKYKKIHMMSCLVKCDGREIRPDVLDNQEGQSLRQFPQEKPTPAMLATWNDAIATLASDRVNGKMCLPSPLGKFLREPLRHDGWYSSTNECTLYHDTGQATHAVYEKVKLSETRQTRGTSNRYRELERRNDNHPGTKYASVDVRPSGDVVLHSTALIPRTTQVQRSFLETLHSFPNQSMWNDLQLDGNGEWVSEALSAGTLVLVHDGSYNENLDPTKCSAAYIIMCKKTKKRMHGTVVDKNENASNYRAELLGALCCLLIVKAAANSGTGRGTCAGYCDNKGVVLHCAGSKKHDKLKSKQSQDDLVRLCKEMLRGMDIDVNYHHVRGHMDDLLRRDQMTLQEDLNVEADDLADKALRKAIRTDSNMCQALPYEQIKVVDRETGEKATGSIATALSKWRGRRMCRALFERKRMGSRILWSQYDYIYWEGMEHVMKSFPRRFRNWVTKQVSGMCGCTAARAHWIKDLVDKCPSCGKKGDTSTHVTRCEDPGREAVFRGSVAELTKWMQENDTEPHLLIMISTYLLARENDTMESITKKMHNDLPEYYSKIRLERMAKVQDRLGWDCMMEGRIPKIFVEHQRTHLAHTETRMTAKRWARGFIQRLLQMTHKQWLLRNAKVHIKCKGDLTKEEHDKLLHKIETLMWTDPDDLLPEDHKLLDEDFDMLGKASALDQQLWVAEMEASITAESYNNPKRKKYDTDRRHETSNDDDTMRTEPIDLTDELGSEGSGAWQRKRWK